MRTISKSTLSTELVCSYICTYGFNRAISQKNYVYTNIKHIHMHKLYAFLDNLRIKNLKQIKFYLDADVNVGKHL